MKVYKPIVLIGFLALIQNFAYSENYTSEKKAITASVVKKEGANLKAEPENKAVIEQKKLEGGKIIAQKICLGEDCKSKWPALKCESYGARPAGETGDGHCSSMNKTCMSVSIGGGQSFFGECSVPVDSVHECRCCWVE